MQFKIKLNTPEDIAIFSNIVKQYDFIVDIVSSDTKVDAKSDLGLNKINLGEPFILDVHGDDYDSTYLMSKLIEYID